MLPAEATLRSREHSGPPFCDGQNEPEDDSVGITCARYNLRSGFPDDFEPFYNCGVHPDTVGDQQKCQLNPVSSAECNPKRKLKIIIIIIII